MPLSADRKILRKLKGAVSRARSGRRASDPRGKLGFEAAVYRGLNEDLRSLTDEAAWEHFQQYGIDELRPFTLAYAFSPDFYREMYADVRALSASSSYRHWINSGFREGRFPSKPLFLRSLGVPIDDIPADFSIDRYKAPYPDLAHMSRYEGFQHFIRHGLREGRALPFAPGEGRDFLRLLSDIYRSQGDVTMAALALDRVLAAVPDDYMALQAYGDMQLAAGHNFVARALYGQALNINPSFFWTLVNAAVAAQNLGLHDEAIALFRRARHCEPGLEMPRQRLRHAAATRFNLSLLTAAHKAAAGDRGAAQTIVREAIGAYRDIAGEFSLPAPTATPSPRKPRIAMLAAHLIPVCWEYRVKQKQLQMEAAGYEFQAWPYSEIDDFQDHLHLFDIAIFFRLPADPGVLDAIAYADRLGVKTVYEIDDLLFDEENYPPAYETFSGLVDRFWYAGLVGSATQHKAALKMCDYGLASTPALERAIAPLVRSGKAFLHRNALNTTRSNGEATAQTWRHRGEASQHQITAFYGSGSKSHNENFDALAAPALAAAFEKYPNFRLMITGPLVIGDVLAPYLDRIEHREFISDANEYQSLLAAADISLAPLTRSIFNDCKSEIKWLEAALLGVPSLVSSSDMYERTLTSGIDAFVAQDATDWSVMLDRLIQDGDLRRAIATAARAKALAEYSLEPMAANLASIIETISHSDVPSTGSALPARKRLLIVNTHFDPQSIGGATRSVEGIVDELVRRYSDEYELEVFSAVQFGRPGSVVRYQARGVNVTAIAPWDRPDLGVGDTDNAVGDVFRSYLERYPADLIHFHAMQLLSASPLVVAQDLNIPYVVTAHDGWWLSSHPFLADDDGTLVMDSGMWGDAGRISRLKTSLEKAAVVIAPSKTFAALYRAREITNTIALQNGVTAIKNVPAPPKSGPITLGLLGGLGVAKGAVLLRHALTLADFPNLDFIVVDHSAPETAVRKEVWGSTYVTIIGRVPQDEIGALYARLHGVLAISVCAESFGLVAREAMSLGRWVIASDRGAVGEDISPGINGFKIDVSTPEQLIDVLNEVNGAPDIYRNLNFSPSDLTTIAQQADALVATYRGVLSASTK